jgi:uncharacterized membrane protein
VKTRALNIFDSIRTSFWFIPTAMSLASAALAFFATSRDYRQDSPWTGWIWSGGPEGAREVLSVIASAMITVAGVVFSITIVALALTSSQYGPRLLRRFMRDPGNQFVLGTFVSTYLYCLLVLRMVRETSGQVFVPHLSVAFAILFAGTSVCVLIYFIHHVAASIHVESVTSSVAQSLFEAIDEMFPEEAQNKEDYARPQLPPAEKSTTLKSTKHGYIQGIDNEKLVHLASKNDLLVSLQQHPGNFVHEDMPLALVWAPAPLPRELRQELRSPFLIGGFRTPTQDVDYSIHQLVEIAVRALSPSLNDPFTAVTCLDWLGAALAKVARREFPPQYRYDQEGRLRLVVQLESYPHMMETAFQQIRYYGKTSPVVLLRLMKTLESLHASLVRPEDREAVRSHATATREVARQLPPCEMKNEIEDLFVKLVQEEQPVP